MTETIDRSKTLKPGARKLLLALESLIAEQGIDGVSSREVARAAGQKNHSALNYHFGSFEGAVEAIIELRVEALNRRREAAISELQQRAVKPTVRDWVRLMLEPLADELLKEPNERLYLNLLSQLMSRRHWRRLFLVNRARSAALREVSNALREDLLQSFDQHTVDQRLQHLGSHILASITQWDDEITAGELSLTTAAHKQRIEDLLDYFCAALCAPENS